MLSTLLMTVKVLVVLFGAIELFAYLLKEEDARWVKGTPRILLMSLFVIGMWAHYVGVLYLAIFLLAAFLPKSRAEAAAVFAVILVAVPPLSMEWTIGPLYLFAVNKYIPMALGLAVATMMRPKDRSVPSGSHFDLPVLLILLLEFVAVRDPKITVALRGVIPLLIAVLIPYFCISRSLRRVEDIRRFMVAIMLGGFVMAVVAVVEWRLEWLIYKQIEMNLHFNIGINPYSKLRGGTVRSPASFPESTSLALYLALSCIVAVGMKNRFKSYGKWWAAMLVFALGLVAANSRGGFLGLAIGLVALDLYRRKYGGAVAKVVGAGGVYLCLLTAAQFSRFFAEMIGKGSSESTADYRKDLFRRGMEEISKHPLFGEPMTTALSNLEDLRQGEHIIDLVNGYIRYGLVFGYTGMLMLVVAFVSLCTALVLIRRRLLVSDVTGNAGAIVFAVSAYSIPASFYTGFGSWWSISFYQLCAVGSALWAIQRSVARGDANNAAAVHSSPVQRMIAADRASAWSGPRPGRHVSRDDEPLRPVEA